jgi:hypothetical protein
MKHLSQEEIRRLLESAEIHVKLLRDYLPSSNPDEAAYQEIDFIDRSWKRLVLTATRRAKISRQLVVQQTAIQRKPSRLEYDGYLRVRILTVEAAMNLQEAGWELHTTTRMRSAAG